MISSKQDGHTLLIGNNATNFIPALAKAPKYHPINDLTPIALLQDVPNILVVHSSVPPVLVRPSRASEGQSGKLQQCHCRHRKLFTCCGRVAEYHDRQQNSPRSIQRWCRSAASIVNRSRSNRRDADPQCASGYAVGSVESLGRDIAGGNAFRSCQRLRHLPKPCPAMMPTTGTDCTDHRMSPEQILAAIAEASDQALASSAMRDFARDGGTAIVRMKPAEFSNFARDDFEKWSKLIADAGLEKN